MVAPVAYIKSQCKRYLLIVTLCKKWRYKCTTSVYMHHDSEKSQAIHHPSITALGLHKKEERRWTKCVGGDIQNTNLQCDSDEVKGCSKHGCPCMPRWSKSLSISTQQKNLAKHLPLYRHHFGPRLTWQLILASQQAFLHALTPVHSSWYAPRHETSIWRRQSGWSRVHCSVSIILNSCQLCTKNS